MTTTSPAPSFVQARTLQEALDHLAQGGRPIAGGTDLVVAARSGRSALPASLVAIDRIDELRTITRQGSQIRIGAAVTHAQILADTDIRTSCTALADAAGLVGSPATRNVGTIGGNIMNASPAADTAAPLVTAAATVELASVRGVRSIPISDLWSGPGRTTTADDELCTAIVIDVDPGTASTRPASAYMRLEYRRAMEIAVVGAAASLRLASDGSVSDLRVALTAVAPTIVALGPDALDTDAKTPDDAGHAAAAAAKTAASPISDVRASESYRREMVAVMARRAVSIAAQRASGQDLGVPANRHVGIGAAFSTGVSR